ncbi:LINE-1 reverse transcriptase like, partial [Trifolium medium]|nr:LINE-1 reverse transcriptase like [Trifolium medium]
RLPFKYLGLPVGANPRLYSTWLPMLETIKRRLRSWGNKYVSLGGRIVLINAVLSAIPIFFLAYMRMPLKVWREVVRIQRNFLWGGLSKKRRICWVKWEDLCKPKKEGGLGIRNLRWVNLSLLDKWRWRLLSDEEEVWKNVILAKYGEGAVGSATLESIMFGNLCSTWWRDVCNLDKEVGWFNQVVCKKVGRENSVNFWKDVWVGNQSLELRFPRLFGMSVQQHKRVENMGMWENGVWRWELRWRRNFFEWEIDLARELEEVLNDPRITTVADRWIWRLNEVDGFSVKSLYTWLDHFMTPRGLLTTLEAVSFSTIWKSAVPSKVSALAWQLFLDRIPTKDNLCRRRIIRFEDASCDICGCGYTAGCYDVIWVANWKWEE